MLKQIESRSNNARKALDNVGTLYEYERTITNLIHEIRWLHNRIKGLEKQADLKDQEIARLQGY